MFAASFHKDQPANETVIPPLEVSKAVGSATESVTDAELTDAETGLADIQARWPLRVQAVTSVEFERFSENVATIRSIFPLEFESKTLAESRRGTALSTEGFETGARRLPARSSNIPVGA